MPGINSGFDSIYKESKSSPQQKEVSSLSPEELLRLDSVNGIPIDILNKYLKPVREYVAAEFESWGIIPDEDLLSKCTPMDEFPNHVLIDRGLIGPHDDIRQILALQKAFVDDVLKFDNPHQIIADEMEKILELAAKTKGGSEIIDFKGIAGDKRLVVIRFSSPTPAISPFQDKDASNVDIRIYDVTGAEKIDASLLKDCERNGKTIMLSGLQSQFARKYGFYEEAQPLLEYDNLFDGGKAAIQNIHTFLPEGLHILGITDQSIDELRRKYKDFQKKYKESPEASSGESTS